MFVDRAEAMRQLNDAKLSAALIIPEHFTSNYLTGRDVRLELVKNPAEQIHPAVLEELLGVAATAMNAVSRNFGGEFPAWQRVAEGKADYHEISKLVEDEGNRVQAIRKYLFPPLVGWTNAAGAAASPSAGAKPGPKFNIFGYLLAGMGGMFFLLLANQGINDLHREWAMRTFERYATLHERLLPFVAGKALFTVVIVSIGAAIIYGGGTLFFRIEWPRPFALAWLTLAYVCFATGLMAMLAGFSHDEKRANAMNNVVSMVLSMAGGCMFPPEALPAAVRNHMIIYLPTYWYSSTARELWWSDARWPLAAAKLLIVGAVCLTIAAFLYRRRLREGIRG